MTRRLSRIAAGVAVLGTLVVPASAAAGPLGFLNPIVSPLYHTQTGGYQYDGESGDPRIFSLAFSDLHRTTNAQHVTGTFGNQGLFAGFAVSHDYYKPGDNATYELSGVIDPTGASPDLPVVAIGYARFDRTKQVYEFSWDGTIAGRPFTGTSGPQALPLF